MINANIKGLDKILDNIDTYTEEMDIGVQSVVEEVVELIATKAMDLAPVDTGKLRRSIKYTVKKMTKDIIAGNIEVAVKYAKHIEYGTSDTKAQPFLEPAIEEGIKRLNKELQEAHKRATTKFKKY